MIFAYITSECERTVPQIFKEALEKIKRDIGRTQSLFSFESFRGSQPYYKKFLGKKGRLVAYRKDVEVDDIRYTVVVFIQVFQRGNKKYEEFFQNLRYNNPTSLDNFIPDKDTLSRYIQEQLKTPEFLPKQECSDSEHGFLNDMGSSRAAASKNNFEVNTRNFIFESQEWLNSVKIHEKFLRDINEALIENESVTLDQAALGGKLIPVKNRYHTEAWILYYSNGDWRILANLCFSEEEINQNRAHWQNRIEAIKTTDSLRQAVRRGYPINLLGDLELWERVEKDPTSNYVLSAEETDVFTRFRSGGAGFPLFINGRAGSDKSTVLQYLFTEYFCRAINQSPPIPPLFISLTVKN